MAAQLSAPSGASTNSAVPIRRNLSQVIATKLLRASGMDLARVIGKDESAVSRLKSGERAVNFLEFFAVLDFLGYKIVSKEKKCIDARELDFLRAHYMHTHGGLADDFDEAE